mmetsp:Transcript_32242/g.102260  ORF Transcript_32242/g.102260 Transcript_32242/m.102260 type:complete len:224 (-) Transcript_32242:273-944(-)
MAVLGQFARTSRDHVRGLHLHQHRAATRANAEEHAHRALHRRVSILARLLVLRQHVDAALRAQVTHIRRSEVLQVATQGNFNQTERTHLFRWGCVLALLQGLRARRPPLVVGRAMSRHAQVDVQAVLVARKGIRPPHRRRRVRLSICHSTGVNLITAGDLCFVHTNLAGVCGEHAVVHHGFRWRETRLFCLGLLHLQGPLVDLGMGLHQLLHPLLSRTLRHRL